MNDMNEDRQRLSSIPGLAILGCFVVGVAGLIGAIVALCDVGGPVGAGVCLIASAFAFGLAANAVFRK